MMNFKAPRCREKFVTDITFISFNASMCLLVSCQCALNSKCTETLSTFVRLLMSVYTNVTHKITGLLELFATVGALVPTNSIHLYQKKKNLHHLILNTHSCEHG